jgi:CDP-diacylglycerol--serine O-phosphatidyltransferase
MNNTPDSLEHDDSITETQKPRRRRGIYLLPNLFTTASLFSGFYSIVSAMGGEYERSAIAIFIAMIFDGLDGRVARMTNTQSDFGKEYDSLSDMMVFGVCPAVVMYMWALNSFDPELWIWAEIGWLTAFFYCAAAALRLARFNTMAGTEKEEKRYFLGMPSPSAAAMVMGMIWCATHNGLSGESLNYLAIIVTFAAGFFMVSNVRFRSFKDLSLEGRVPFRYLLFLVGIFALIAVSPANVLFAAAMIFAVSGPVGAVMRRVKGEPATVASDDHADD